MTMDLPRAPLGHALKWVGMGKEREPKRNNAKVHFRPNTFSLLCFASLHREKYDGLYTRFNFNIGVRFYDASLHLDPAAGRKVNAHFRKVCVKTGDGTAKTAPPHSIQGERRGQNKDGRLSHTRGVGHHVLRLGGRWEGELGHFLCGV